MTQSVVLKKVAAKWKSFFFSPLGWSNCSWETTVLVRKTNSGSVDNEKGLEFLKLVYFDLFYSNYQCLKMFDMKVMTQPVYHYDVLGFHNTCWIVFNNLLNKIEH